MKDLLELFDLRLSASDATDSDNFVIKTWNSDISMFGNVCHPFLRHLGSSNLKDTYKIFQCTSNWVRSRSDCASNLRDTSCIEDRNA